MNQGKGIFLLRSQDEITKLLEEREQKKEKMSKTRTRPLMTRLVQRYEILYGDMIKILSTKRWYWPKFTNISTKPVISVGYDIVLFDAVQENCNQMVFITSRNNSTIFVMGYHVVHENPIGSVSLIMWPIELWFTGMI